MIDLLVLVYVAVSAWRGRKRGLVVELPSAVGALVFFFSGWGLFKVMYRGLAEASSATGFTSGILPFALLIVGAYFLVRKFKARIAKLAEHYAPEKYRVTGGAIVAGLRAFVWSSVLLLVLASGLGRGLAESSFLGRGLVRFVLPVYEQTHHSR